MSLTYYKSILSSINTYVLLKNIAYILFIILLALSIYFVSIAPYDYQHKEYTLLLYLHAPIAWTGINLYIVNSLSTIINLFYTNNISLKITKSISFPALIFLALTLFTGSIWGQNSWGTYWAWDARLTSVFILFIFYAIKNIILFLDDDQKNFKLEVLNIFSFTLIPIILFSVNIWHTIHQGSSIQTNAITYEILTPIKFITLTLNLYICIICLKRFTKLN